MIQFTEDSDPSRYEYEWKVVASSSTDDRDKGIILGTERNLRYFVDLKPDSYRLFPESQRYKDRFDLEILYLH